ncbi:nucleolar protein 10-like [Saccoglossus kowalevskii]|uniref:Nucleolar protein 10 n=1 Tax=Saccoglossus kowalevskii TaxID=10224 RepID=A0ABM0GSY7_SACKO|nr:PREDICTED: nucleolar protein 10-like [Saccoglossus kowalevskii]
MQVSNPNNVKIYNLSVGRSLPDWLSDRKRRQLLKNDVDLRRRIELIQDFEMPVVSNCIQVSKDRQYILSTGIYKPRVRCFDVNQLSMKFERCFDSEVVKFHILSEDYSKVVFLQQDRYVEFHAKYGRYYRLRIPKFGRDLAYHEPSCDLYFVGASAEVYRFNLEQGRFLNSLVTDSGSLNVCEINPVHNLFVTGTLEGRVECWDPRMRNRVGILDCALSSVTDHTHVDGMPSISALKFRGSLNMAVGTTTGQILLYDIRSDKPLLVKDHQYGLPIKSIEFHNSHNLVISADSKIVKLWDRDTGKAYTSIEPLCSINDLCVLPDTGLLFLATESPKMQSYFIPSLGPAARWCSFLDNLTEELEEDPNPVVYDDYKFVTKKDLENLGLKHLLGTNLLRAYMHGFFMDIRLYHKAKSIAEPFAYEDYKKKKIREKIEATRTNRVKVDKLPAVNKELAQKIIEKEDNIDKKKKKKVLPSLLKDDRFAVMFKNPDFQVDLDSEEFRMLNPMVARMEKQKEKKHQAMLDEKFDEIEEEEGRPSDEESSSDEEEEREWREEMKRQHHLVKQEERMKRKVDTMQGLTESKPKFYELKSGEDFKAIKELTKKRKHITKSFGERINKDSFKDNTGKFAGSKEMTFTLRKNERESAKDAAARQHKDDRLKVGRSAKHLLKKERKPGMVWRKRK